MAFITLSFLSLRAVAKSCLKLSACCNAACLKRTVLAHQVQLRCRMRTKAFHQVGAGIQTAQYHACQVDLIVHPNA